MVSVNNNKLEKAYVDEFNQIDMEFMELLSTGGRGKQLLLGGPIEIRNNEQKETREDLIKA